MSAHDLLSHSTEGSHDLESVRGCARGPHVTHVARSLLTWAVLKCLQEHGLYVKLEKCKFHTWRVGFVGYVVTLNGVSMEEDCVLTIHDWPEPQTHREVQVFLGFANFYR